MTERAPEAAVDTSRRDLLFKTATLAGAGALLACKMTNALEEPIPVATKVAARVKDGEAIRVGLIGTGGMGNGHLDGMLAAREAGREQLDLVALSDVCKPRLDRALSKCSERQKFTVDGYRDYHELLAREDVHAVLIASPEHWHAQMAIDAIAAGKDVYLEKPMTLKLEDALRLRKTVQRNDRILQVGTQYMMVPKYSEARKLIAEGAIGKPTLVQTSYCRNSRNGEWLYDIEAGVVPGEMLDWERWCGPLGVDAFDTEVYHRWRRYKKWSTGIIGDLLVHQMTPLLFALDAGWPLRVSAVGGHYVDKAMENHDQVLLTIELEGEITLMVVGSTCNELGLDPLIRGHKANLLLGGNNCVLRPERIFEDEVEPAEIQCPGIDDQGELRLDWLHCVRTRGVNRSRVDLGAKVMVIVDLATRSMWGGKAWRFDPATMSASPA